MYGARVVNRYEETTALSGRRGFASREVTSKLDAHSMQDEAQMTQMPHVLVVDDDRRLRVLGDSSASCLPIGA